MSEWGRGQVVAGRYRLLDPLGQGGMALVWRAEHLELGTEVAIKLLDPSLAQNADMVARLLREARASAAVQSRHVIRVFDHGIEQEVAFLVMELLEGETLGARIRRRGPLGAAETVRFMCQVMQAVGVAHEQGIVHRDLKPDNIFITRGDEGDYVKVLDFGVAKVSSPDFGEGDGLRTQAGVMLGTPYYMSPEQAKAGAVDHRTDLWALAVITFECLLGKRPFTGDSFADLLVKLCSDPLPVPSNFGQVPLGFDEWFVRGTQRDRERRFSSAREMADELMDLASGALIGRALSRPAPADTLGRGAPLGQEELVPAQKSSPIALAVLGILAAAGAGAALAHFLP